MKQSKKYKQITNKKKFNNILKKLNNNTKTVISKTKPFLVKGVSSVYGTLANGFNMSVKRISKTMKNIKSKKNKKYNKTSRKH
jgi:hypothetical protein